MAENKTKILFLISSLVVRGAERMLVNLVNRLDQDQFTIQVVALSKDNPLASQINPEVAKFTALPRKWRFDMQPAREIRKIIKNDLINVVVGFDIFCFFYIWVALLWIQPKPKIFISIHNMTFRNSKHFLQNLIISRLLSDKDVILSVCKAQARYWSKTYRLPEKKFTTIYNGVDTDLFTPSDDIKRKKLIRSQFKIPEDAIVILQVAYLAVEKGHIDSLIAFKNLIDMDASKPYLLAFVGGGPEELENKLKQIAKDLGIFDRVLFYGVQNDVKSYYEIADIFTLTSNKVETFSVAALEAMSMGLPSVLTDLGGAREMIIDGVNGYLVQPSNPVQIANGWFAVNQDKDCLDRKNIRNKVVENFSLTACVHNYEREFK